MLKKIVYIGEDWRTTVIRDKNDRLQIDVEGTKEPGLIFSALYQALNSFQSFDELDEPAEVTDKSG